MSEIGGILMTLLLIGGGAWVISGFMSDAKVKEYQLQETQQQLHDTQTEFNGYRDGVKDSQ